MKPQLFVWLLAWGCLLCWGNSARADFIVAADQTLTVTGILATSGESFTITATGSVNLANTTGNYVTDPNGVITTAPKILTAAGIYFSLFGTPIGSPATVGGSKDIPSYVGSVLGRQTGDPYGALLAGFSTTANPTSLSQFPGGFVVVGSSDTITAPSTGGYLFFEVNDTLRFDDSGSFDVKVQANSGGGSVQSVPEPTALTLVGVGLFGVLAGAWRTRRNRSSHPEQQSPAVE